MRAGAGFRLFCRPAAALPPALTRVATPANERRLLDFALSGTAAHVERLARAWRRVDRLAEGADEQRRQERRSLTTWVDDDGMVVIRGRLSPEVGAVVRRALEAAADRLRAEVSPEEAAETSVGQRQADALGVVAESALAADLDRGTAGDRYQVVLHVEAEMLRAEGGEPDVSAETRLGGCHARRCDAHHVRSWADGGPTRLDNLVLLCRRHHRAVHEEGFQVGMGPAGDTEFRWPDGRPFPDAPVAPAWSGPPLAPTDERLAAAEIAIGPDTATPDWYGERLDLGYAIDVMWKPRTDPCEDAGSARA